MTDYSSLLSNPSRELPEVRKGGSTYTLWRFETSLLPVARVVVKLLTERSCHCRDCLPDVREGICRQIMQREMC